MQIPPDYRPVPFAKYYVHIVSQLNNQIIKTDSEHITFTQAKKLFETVRDFGYNIAYIELRTEDNKTTHTHFNFPI